jgi:hypothetical protein
MAGTEADAQPGPPILRVVRGAPDGVDIVEDLAALVAVLAARGTGSDETPPQVVSGWVDRSHGVRQPLHAAPGGWRRSALPR